MKTIIIVLTSLLFSNYSASAQNTLPKDKVELKIKHYKHLKSIGNAIAYTGGAATVVGLYLYSQTINSNFYSSGLNRPIVGPTLTVIGVGMIAGGATMATIGNFKKKKYQQQLSGLTFMPLLSPNINGICLQYKF